MKDDSYFYLEISKSFYKVSEDLKVLDNQSFELRGIDSDIKIEGFTFIRKYDGLHFLKDSLYSTYGEIGHIIPSVLKERLEKLKTKDDVILLANELENYSSASSIYFPLPIKVKQISTPDGYIKNDLIYFLNCTTYFDYDEDNNIIDMEFSSSGYNSYDMIRAENFTGFNSFSDFIKYSQRYEMEPKGDTTCMDQALSDGKIMTDAVWTDCQTRVPETSSYYELVNYFIDYKGEVELKIDTTVNGALEFNAKDNKELNYEITVKNTGTATSGNNVIVANVPNELIVIEESISDDGELEDDNSIFWRIDTLDSNEEYKVSYSAVVSPTADKNKTYIAKTAVSSNQSDEVYSKETKVFLNKSSEVINGKDNLVNPNTYNTAVFGFSFILVILVIGTYFVKKRITIVK